MTVLDLYRLLDDLGKHAADMQLSGQEHHDDCSRCQTMILLSRVARFGMQLRDAELEFLR